MTTFATNTRNDLNAPGRKMQKASEMGKVQIWRLTNLIPAFWARTTNDPQEEVAKNVRREAARSSGTLTPAHRSAILTSSRSLPMPVAGWTI